MIRPYKVAPRSATQITFCDPGVGTMPEGEEASGLKQKKSIIAGLAFGSGFKEDSQDAYRFLMQV